MRFTFFLLITCVTFASDLHAVEIIKKSSSFVCHDTASRWYNKTKNFTAYASMSACVASGGHAYSGYQVIPSEPATGSYNRKLFPHWLDEDRNCRDTRAETLITQSTTPVTFKSSKRCQVISGSWYDPYTDNRYYSDDDLDIDHIVPLKWAFEHGASTWTQSARAAFANDPDNLIAVSLSANRSKSDKGPTEWLPPNQAYRCDYLTRFRRVMSKYLLTMRAAEHRVFHQQLEACQRSG